MLIFYLVEFTPLYSHYPQEHVVKHLSVETANNIIELIKDVSRQVGTLYIKWFGGEPLLQYKMIQYLMIKAEPICKENNCKFRMFITTNGYLIDKEKIIEMKKYGLQGMQVTIDGSRTVHNLTRTLCNGEGTYDRILENMILALENGIHIVLRINIPEKMKESECEILNGIPEKYRKLVTVDFCNVFQNEKKISTFLFMKRAIEMGFGYSGRRNSYNGCDAGGSNSLYIDTNGDILLCSNVQKGEKNIGTLGLNGKVEYKNMGLLYEFKTISARDNEQCKNCIELPFCIGACKYARLKNNNECIGIQNDALTLEERACLDYYYDRKLENAV